MTRIITFFRGFSLRENLTFKVACITIFLNLFSVVHTSGQTNSFTVGSIIGTTVDYTRNAKIADFDNDGDNDIAFYSDGANYRLYKNSGTGTFANTYTELIPYGSTGGTIEPADLDGDGDIDIVATNGRVYINNGSGTFTQLGTLLIQQNTGGGIAAIKIADINSDGKNDIIWSNNSNGTNAYNEVWLNTGTTGSAAFTYSTRFAPSANGMGTLDVGDIDGDGDLDIVVGINGGSGNSVDVFKNTNGTFTNSQVGGSYAYKLLLNDWDKDGDLDLLTWSSYNSFGLRVFLNNGTGTFGSLYYTSPVAGSTIDLGDINGDGYIDAVIGYGSSSPVSILINNGCGLVEKTDVAVAAPHGVILGDVSGDGKLDLFIMSRYNTSTNQSKVYLNDLSLVSIKTAPGNALNFDGTDDYVSIPDASSLDLTSNYTIEAWIKPTSFSFLGGIVSKYQASGSNGYVLRLGLTAPYTGINFDGLETATGILEAGKWYHIAAVKSGSTRTLYINGVAVAMPNGSAHTTAANTDVLAIGVDYLTSPRYFNGSIDEVRIWNTARTLSEITTNNKVSISACTNANLVAYYKLDNGTAGGSNGSYYVANDASTNNNNGFLTNFSLSTGTTSNWVESYAMVVPTAAAATSIGTTGFTANWTAPANGTVTNYLLDVSTSSSFSSFVSGYNGLSVSGTSQAVTGLSAGTTYYYRVRADKASVTGEGAYSSIITAATINALDKLGLSNTQASAAYGLRLLSSNYSGPLVRISNGSAFYDVYPDATTNKVFSLTSKISAPYATYNAASTGSTTNDLSTVITAGVTGAYGVIWYDQSGNGNDAYQSLSANRPILMTAGAIRTSSGKPTFQFNTSNTYSFITINNVSLIGAASSNVVSQAISAGASSSQYVALVTQNYPVSGQLSGTLGRNGTSNLSYGVYTGSAFENASYSTDYPTTPFIATGTYGGTSLNLYVNGRGTAATASSGLGISRPLIIGKRWDSGDGYNGYISEVVVFNSTLSNTDRQLIEASQSTYYGISVYSTNTDAHLSALTSTAGTLTPTFDTSVVSYSFNVSNATTSITVTPTVYVAGATVKVNNVSTTSGSPSASINLNTGLNTITVQVTALDGTTTKTYTINITRALNTWMGGTSTDFNNPLNWSGGAVPTVVDDFVIAASANNPQITGTHIINHLTINTGASLTVTGTLQIAGNINNSGTLTATSGTIELNGSTAQTIPANTFASNTVRNLTINNSAGVSLGGPLTITGVLTPTAGTLTTGGYLTLASSATATASIAAGTGTYISGTVNVQRYSQAQRGYRTISHPYNTTQSVRQLVDNFQITGLSTTTSSLTGTYGTTTGNPSIFYYDGTKPAGSVSVLGRIYNADSLNWPVGRGLYAFIRGNGNEGSGGSYASSGGVPSSVVLDVKTGNINQGDVTVNLTPYTVGADNFTLVGNPYPCPINLSGVTGIGSFGTIYLYNPIYSAGATTLVRGGFESTGSSNIVIPSMGCFYIQSTASTPSSITFHESDKITSGTPSYNLFGTGNQPQPKLVLQLSTADGFMDRTAVVLDNTSSNSATDFHDAAKLGNSLATFYSLSSDSKALAIDYRANLNTAIPLGIQTTNTTNYTISLSELTDLPNTQLVLRDKLLKTETVLSKVGDSYSFNITADTATKGDNRFEIGLLGTTVLPVQITDITAQLQANKTVAVNWTSTTEVNLSSYKVQRSKDGSNFTTVGTVAAKGASVYSFNDDLSTAGVLPSTIYYRLEAVDKDGSKTYSKVVAVALGSNLAKAAINIYPNPVQATLFAQVTVTKADAAQLRVVDAQGKVVATQKTQLGVGTTSVSIPAAQLTAGNYVLEIDSADGKQTQRFVKE